jgi:hypothetical protein
MSNAVICVDQATWRVALSVNGLAAVQEQYAHPSHTKLVGMCELRLEGVQMVFVEEQTLFIVPVDGTIVPFEFVVDGKVVLRLVVGKALVQTAPPMVVRKVHGKHLFVGAWWAHLYSFRQRT